MRNSSLHNPKLIEVGYILTGEDDSSRGPDDVISDLKELF